MTSSYQNHSSLDLKEYTLLRQLRKDLLGNENHLIAERHVNHTDHSKWRACQRAIDTQILNLTLEFGTPFYRQGMVFYTVLKNNIPKNMDHSVRSKLKNIVVLLSSNGYQIVTCFRAKNAVKFLRRKPKELKRRRR